MSKQSLKTYGILTAFVLVLLGLIVGSALILKPVKEKNIMKVNIKKYSEVLDKIDTLEILEIDEKHTLILDKQLAKDASGKELGNVYTAKDFNGYGSITIVIAVDSKGLILDSSAVEVDQSMHADATAAMIKSLKGTSILDDIKNVTGATISSSTVENILNQIKESQVVVEDKDLFEDLFGEGYVKEKQTFTATTHTKEHVLVKVDGVVKGSSYVIDGTGIFDDFNEANIKFDIILDDNNVIIGYEILNYKHSGGTYKRNVEAYLNLLITDKVNMFNYADHTDNTTGSTNSKTLLKTMLTDLSTVVGGN